MSGARRYRRRPSMVEAIQFSGDNIDDIHAWANGPAWDPNNEDDWQSAAVGGDEQFVVIATLHGETEARPGDWILRGEAGDYWPVRSDIFEATYYAVSDPPGPSVELETP